MKSFTERLLGKRSSATDAKERLQLLLVHDRAALPPGKMAALRDELISVISRHIEVDRAGVHIEITHEGRSQRLLADIPIKTVVQRGE